MEFINQYKQYAEFAYLLSGPLMLISLVIGMIQVYHMRIESKIKIERESIKLSIEVLEKKTHLILKLVEDVIDAEHECGINTYKVKYNDNFILEEESSREWFEKFQSDGCNQLHNSAIELFNAIEGLAYYLNSGIADDKFCFEMESKSILELVDRCGKYLAAHLTLTPDHYQETLQMIRRWNGMNKIHTIKDKKKELEREEASLKNVKPVSVVGKK